MCKVCDINKEIYVIDGAKEEIERGSECVSMYHLYTIDARGSINTGRGRDSLIHARALDGTGANGIYNRFLNEHIFPPYFSEPPPPPPPPPMGTEEEEEEEEEESETSRRFRELKRKTGGRRFVWRHKTTFRKRRKMTIGSASSAMSSMSDSDTSDTEQIAPQTLKQRRLVIPQEEEEEEEAAAAAAADVSGGEEEAAGPSSVTTTTTTTTGYGRRRRERSKRSSERKARRERRRRRAEEERNEQTSSSERMMVKHISRFPFLCFKIKRPPLAVTQKCIYTKISKGSEQKHHHSTTTHQECLCHPS